MPIINSSINMSLPVPVVGQENGPQWATDLDNCMTIIDAHTHASGSGVQITPDGININKDLTFNTHNATTLRSARFAINVSPISAVSPDLACIYVSGSDLYYNDASGNQIRMTQSGSVAGSSGTITGLPSGTASASYTGAQGTFQFQQITSTAANMDAGTLIIRYPGSYPAPTGNYIAIQAPTTLATGYAFTLPATLPGSSGAFLTSSTAGVVSYTNVDNSSLQISAAVLQVKAGGIAAAMMAASSVVLTSATVTGILPQANGGTGQSTLTSGGTGSASVPALVSGIYTPGYANVANTSGGSPFVAQFMRVGNVVTVSGHLLITTVAGGGAVSQFNLTLPVATTLAAAPQLAGTMSVSTSLTTANESGTIFGNIPSGGNLAEFQWFAATAYAGQTMVYQFTYRVI